jgi:hypothetical protein
VKTFPTDDIADERVTIIIDSIRGKWKAAISQLGMTMQQNEGTGLGF